MSVAGKTEQDGKERMSISLYKHNEDAYDAAVEMLAETGKAAIVHPTGTGKSFIGFKLCADHSSATVCWLSPSEYIFKTQIENLKAVSSGYFPQNIRFFTYAKLMNMSGNEVQEISPDYIILDEFHRCGAEQWGNGVQNLLDAFPAARVLGLSATAIRYLDNQRDMADELFGGNIASEMTLGEAIVRGILNPPKYVLSVFAYQKDLEKYELRVRKVKSKATRDQAEQYLQELRRALENAEGLDEIFCRHMEEKAGKYIVFCANKEHMVEMMRHTEWFSKVDKAPHIYSVYASDPSASKSFQAFKDDHDNRHLRLLFCIDALNEGIHLEDISGVILLRPTVSPIIYKQQIGRALSASKKNNAVIFDIVLNIENLYSIGAVEEEMQVATAYYRSLGMDDSVVNEHFRVVDEVRDCIALFEKLNDTLNASWDLMYTHAASYYKEHGNLEVPHRYKTEEGYSLGHWLHTQRKVKAGRQYGTLGLDRIAQLDAIGMVWESYRDLSWQRYYDEAKKYYDNHGHLNTNVNDVTDSGMDLGGWICRLRSYRKNGAQQSYLTKERIEQLDALGMIWDVPDYLWEENFAEAMAFYRKHGHLDIRVDYVSPSGLRTGSWIRRQRGIRSEKINGAALTDDQIARLDSIGMVWKDKYAAAWDNCYEAAKRFFEEHGHLDVPIAYVSNDGITLGKWVARQREKGSDLSPDRRQALDRLHMIWARPDSWAVRYGHAKRYYEENGNLNIPATYKADGIWIAKWLNEQRQIYIGNRGKKCLTAEQIQKLEAIGMEWGNRAELHWDYAWETMYSAAKSFYLKNGNLKVPKGYCAEHGNRLDVWIRRQRSYKANGKLSDEQIARLDEIGMIWDVKKH